MSQRLNHCQLEAEVEFVCSFVDRHAISLRCMHDWNSGLDIDEWWQEFTIPAAGLRETLAKAISSGALPLGDADFSIEENSGKFRFLLCHEGDLHFSAPEPVLVASVRTHWEEQGYQVHDAPSAV